MNKLIKIKENYYVINDSEIKAGDNYLWLNNNQICKAEGMLMTINNHVKNKHIVRITHSTQKGIGEQLNLNDIEELLYGYSIINLKAKFANEELNSDNGLLGNFYSLSTAFEEGFKAYEELIKDYFSLSEIESALKELAKPQYRYDNKTTFKDILYMQKKTEWNIEFQNGKIILV